MVCMCTVGFWSGRFVALERRHQVQEVPPEVPGEEDRLGMAAALADRAEVRHRLVVLLFVMDEGGAIGPRPLTLGYNVSGVVRIGALT